MNRYIYTAIALCVIVPQVSFGAELYRGFTESEMRELRRIADIKNEPYNPGNAFVDNRADEVSQREILRRAKVPRDIEVINRLERQITNTEIDIEANAQRIRGRIKDNALANITVLQQRLAVNAESLRIAQAELAEVNRPTNAQLAKQYPTPPPARPLTGGSPTTPTKPTTGLPEFSQKPPTTPNKPLGFNPSNPNAAAGRMTLYTMLPYMVFQAITTNIFELEDEINAIKKEIKITPKWDAERKVLVDKLTDLEGEYAARYAEAKKEFGEYKINENRMIRNRVMPQIY